MRNSIRPLERGPAEMALARGVMLGRWCSPIAHTGGPHAGPEGEAWQSSPSGGIAGKADTRRRRSAWVRPGGLSRCRNPDGRTAPQFPQSRPTSGSAQSCREGCGHLSGVTRNRGKGHPRQGNTQRATITFMWTHLILRPRLLECD